MQYQFETPDAETYYEDCNTETQVFYISEMEAAYNRANADHANEFTIFKAGWYYAFIEEQAQGPFESETEAMEAAGLFFIEQPEYSEELEEAF